MTYVNNRQSIEAVIENYLNNEVYSDELAAQLSIAISAQFEVKDDERPVPIHVNFVQNKKEFFGCSVYPAISDESHNYVGDFCKQLVIQHASREELETFWGNIAEWQIDIDSKLFDRGTYCFNPDEITDIILHTLITVAFSTEVVDLVYDTFMNNYMQSTFTEKASMEVLYMLYEIPVMDACSFVNWIAISSDDPMLEKLPKLGETLAKFIKASGNTALGTESTRFYKLDSVMNLMNLYAHDYIKRRNWLRDDVISRAMKTSSLFVRSVYLSILDTMGFQLRERYSGFAMEASSEMFDEPEMLKTKDFYSDIKKSRVLTAAYATIPGKAKMAMEAFGKKPMLPSDKEIDLLFIEIDRMENQLDRKYVLDKIFRLMDRITSFRDFYSDDERIIERYNTTINDQLSRLNKAREEVLNKRTFKKSYKVFVSSPDGYEG